MADRLQPPQFSHVTYDPQTFGPRLRQGYVFEVPDPSNRDEIPLSRLTAIITDPHRQGRSALIQDITVRPDMSDVTVQVTTPLYRAAGVILASIGMDTVRGPTTTVDLLTAQQTAFGADHVTIHRTTSRGTILSTDEAKAWLAKPPARGDQVVAPPNRLFTISHMVRWNPRTLGT